MSGKLYVRTETDVLTNKLCITLPDELRQGFGIMYKTIQMNSMAGAERQFSEAQADAERFESSILPKDILLAQLINGLIGIDEAFAIRLLDAYIAEVDIFEQQVTVHAGQADDELVFREKGGIEVMALP